MRKITVIIMILALLRADPVLGLATLPATQNPPVKRRILARLVQSRVRIPEDQFEKDLISVNPGRCVLLSSGEILIPESSSTHDVDLLREVTEAEIRALLHILKWEEFNNISSVYSSVRSLILKLFPNHVTDGKELDRYVDDIISTAFSWLSLMGEGILEQEDLPEHIGPFLSRLYPVIAANKHSYFTEEFWNVSVRNKRIKKAKKDGLRFYDPDTAAEKSSAGFRTAINELRALTFTPRADTKLGDEALRRVGSVKQFLIEEGESVTVPLASELYRLFSEVDMESIHSQYFHYTRSVLVEILSSTGEEGMQMLLLVFRALEQHYPVHRYFDYLLELGETDSPHLDLFIPFYIKYLKKHVSSDGIIFRTNMQVDPIVRILNKCGDPRGFLKKLRVCSEDHEDTDNTAVFSISVDEEGSLVTGTFPGAVLHEGGSVINYKGADLLNKISGKLFRGTIYKETKSAEGFVRLDPPNGRLAKKEIDELVRICRVLAEEIHPDKHLVVMDQVRDMIEDSLDLTLPDELTLSNFLLHMDNGDSFGKKKARISPKLKSYSKGFDVEGDVTRTVIEVEPEKGLHMKYAREIALLCRGFPRTKAYIKKESKADASQILEVLSLGAGCGDSIEIIADGPRSREMVALIARTINESGSAETIFFAKMQGFPVTHKERRWMKSFIDQNPEILGEVFFRKLHDALKHRLIENKWPWVPRRDNIGEYILEVSPKKGKSAGRVIREELRRPSVILQDFLELYSMPYAKIAAEKWHEMVKELAAGILKVNMEVSFEEKVIVFGANMRRYGPNVPLRFIVRPGRYMARVRGIAGREKGPVVQDSFIEDESDMIRGLIAGEIGNEDGFIRLNATSFEEPVFLLAQLKKLALFLIESGVSPGKDLVFTGKMTTFIEERLGARLPEELTLQEFVNFMATRKKMPGIVKKKGKEFSSVFGLPIRKKAMVDISKGIHNKTAAFIVEIASSFPGAKIYMRKGSRVASAHDRVELMHLAVGDGEDVEILAVGPGAQTAVEMIVHFLKDGTTATKDQILSELKHIFDKWRMEGVRLFQDLRYTHDIKSTKVLFHDLLYGSVNTGTRYELRYDVSRLSPAQVDLVKTYSRIFEEQLGYRDLITFKPFSGELSNKNTEDIPLFSVIALREKTIRGEGNVFVDVAEGDIEEYILRIPGLLNIVFAAANIETGLSEDEINNEYPALIGFIKTQCILILGEEHFSRDIVRDFRSIRLTLPKIYKHDLSAPIDEYNRETREILIKA